MMGPALCAARAAAADIVSEVTLANDAQDLASGSLALEFLDVRVSRRAILRQGPLQDTDASHDSG